MTKVAAVIVAAGRGLRAGGPVAKQYRLIHGAPVVRTSARRFTEHPRIATVQPVIHPDDAALFTAAVEGLGLRAPVPGGATRQASVRAGLEALADAAPDIVLVHDAARPYLSAALIDRAIDAAVASGAAVPGLAPVDTIKQVDASGAVLGTIDRNTLRTVQTPQAFRYDALREAHRRAAEAGREDFTDDAALAEWAGLRVTVFEGEAANIKLTSADDFARTEERRMYETRVGTGFDVHAFGDGDHVTLAGIKIPHPRGVTGHSDADVALHALTDAVLGAIADGDIGSHFPPSDPQWRGASSDRFLAYAIGKVTARGGRIVHLDTTIVCEAPRVGPHRDAMRARIAEIAGITIDRVGVKATTNEKMGFIGREEGLVAYAAATIMLPIT